MLLLSRLLERADVNYKYIYILVTVAVDYIRETIGCFILQNNSIHKMCLYIYSIQLEHTIVAFSFRHFKLHLWQRQPKNLFLSNWYAIYNAVEWHIVLYKCVWVATNEIAVEINNKKKKCVRIKKYKMAFYKRLNNLKTNRGRAIIIKMKMWKYILCAAAYPFYDFISWCFVHFED